MQTVIDNIRNKCRRTSSTELKYMSSEKYKILDEIKNLELNLNVNKLMILTNHKGNRMLHMCLVIL